jgi:hypothetical protein
MYNWHPVRTDMLESETMGIVEQCMNIPSTLAILDSLASGDATHDIESFHALRCHFATKTTFFGRWAMRNNMAKLHYNENLGREALYTYKSRQRRLGKTINKTKRVNATWEWQSKVIARVMKL